MTITTKEGVQYFHLKYPMRTASEIIGGVFEEYGYPCIITSTIEGRHESGSLHYCGLAADYRTRHLPDNIKKNLINEIIIRLIQKSECYQVIAEKTHLHVEYDRRNK